MKLSAKAIFHSFVDTGQNGSNFCQDTFVIKCMGYLVSNQSGAVAPLERSAI